MVQTKMRIFFIFLSFFVVEAFALTSRDINNIPICNDKEYLIKNYFYKDKANGAKEKDWHRYYNQVDESSVVVDISMSLMREVAVPDKLRFIFTKDGKNKKILDKDFALKRVEREFFLEGFDYKKVIPEPQSTPGKLQMVLLRENKPLCRVEQKFVSISYD